VEAIFIYTIIQKNYDRDPNTVDYIKSTKENKDPNYQTYYDEYLKPRESNMEIKAVINKEGDISLYTDNDPHNSREWVEFQMSDCIISNH